MSRLPYSAEQLLDQVKAHRPDVEVTEGEPDGLDVVREIKFDKGTSEWLWPLMKDNLDQRLASGLYNEGVLTLTFQARSVLADDRSPFDLPVPAEAEAVAEPEKPKSRSKRERRVDSGEHGGEFVTEEYAEAHPDTTVAESRD